MKLVCGWVCWACAHSFLVLVHQPNLFWRQGSVTWFVSSDACWALQFCRVFDLLPTLDGPAKYLQHDFTHMNGGGRCASLNNGISQRPQVFEIGRAHV